MKKLRRWVGVILVSLAVIAPVILSVTSLSHEAFADTNLTSSDVSAIKQNILYKAVYSNLQRCYNNMQGTINETQNNVWAAFDSATYFKNDALASNFLKFPFDVGKNNESSCPKMITGWKTNWFVNLFGGNGNYSGLLSLNTGAEVPDSSYDSSPTKMGNFLKNIGYTQKTDTTTMGDRKCFYLKFQINSAVYEKYWLPTPSSGTTFETVDYCVKLDGNNLQQYNDSIIALTGNNEYFGTYDDGHLKDESNIAFIYFNTSNGMTPGFYYTDYSGVSWANKNYLQANLTSYLDLRYYFDSATVGHTMEATSIPVKYINNTTNADNSTYCSNLGYTWCGWVDKGILYTKTYIGSLTNPGDSISYSTFKSRMKSVVEHIQDTDGIYLFSNVSTIDFTPGATSYTKGAANTKFMNYFLGNTSNFNGGTLSNAEKYVLYYTYLKESYNVATTTTAISNGVQVSWLNDDGTFTKTYVYDPDENLNDKKYVPQNSQWLNIEELNWKQIAERMAAIDVSTAFDDATVTDPVLDPAVTPTNPDDPGGDSAGLLDGCFSNAGVLGWILCPVLRLASTATNGIYDMIVENYLSVKSETITSSALRDAWGTFQGYANILFAILLVVVILSQVTGIGLSNYGIKKVLPRLIITIVLVNLSYIMCSIAVDLSNIVGVSLNDLFGNAKVTVGGFGDLAASDLNIGTMVINSVEGIGATGIAFVAGGALFTVAAEQWPNLILVLFLAVISILISILFFFILLVVRQAAVILLLVLAPVAVVCYALPNTQKIFDRWLKAFSSLLMVFPICGAVMGGCNYASRLLLSAGGNNGLLYYIIVMVLGVVPLFFIPSILKTSMSALGNVGRTLAGAGDRFNRWANRAIVGSQLYQDRKQEAQRNVNMARNKRIMDHTKLSDAEQSRLDTLRAKRASGAVLSNSERRELKNLGSRQYRYARAASARERGVMEDAMSDVASRREMLEHGSARYEKIVAGAMREQRNRDDAGQIALYEDGKVDAFGGGGKVRGDSLDDLAKEHAALLAHVADNPEDEIAASKLRAVQTLLGKMGPNGFDKMEDNFGNLMANHSQFSSANSKGVGIATSHLSRNFAGQIKANSRTFDKMLTDFNSDRFSQQSTFAQRTFTDAMGKTQTKYMSSYYGAQGAQSIKAENVNDLGDTYYDNLLRATINGDLQGKDLEQVLNVFNEAEAAAAAGKLTLKGEVRQRIKAIKNAAYASSALNGGARSEGSRMIGTAGAAGIDSIVKQIESAGDWSTMSTADKQQYSDLVNNITDSLKKDAHTVEDVRQLQQALATARGKNIETAVTGGTLISQVGTADLHSYKIPRGSKQKVTMPTGWTKTASGKWIDMATGNPLNMTDAAKAEKILEHNASIDVENEV